MALVTCPGCGSPMAESRTACASCGHVRSAPGRAAPGARPIFFAALGIVAAASLMITVGAMTASRARASRGRQQARPPVAMDAGPHATVGGL